MNAKEFLKGKGIKDTLFDISKNDGSFVKGGLSEIIEEYSNSGKGVERLLSKKLENCHDCGAKPGEKHLGNCDVERCSVCGGQKLDCDCKGHNRKFARWTGVCPGKAEANYLGIDLNEFFKYSDTFFIEPK